MCNNTAIDLSWDLLTEDWSVQLKDELVDSVGDGLVKCLQKYAEVDIEYISSVSGEDKQTVLKVLDGVIFQNPDKFFGDPYEGWELSDEYLSGNLLEKYKKAKEGSEKYDHRFDKNIKAIEKLMHCNVHFDDVELQPGMSFVSTYVVDMFIEYTFGKFLPDGYLKNSKLLYCVKRDEITGTWEIPFKNRYRGYISNIATYGTRYRSGMEILEDILNNRDSVVYEKSCGHSTEKRIVNKSATAMVLEKRKLLINRFNKWVKETPEIRELVERSYLEKYGYIRKRIFKGNFIEKEWGNVNLYDYQRDAIARIIFTRNCLLALPVGKGKTNIMIVAALELMRMEIANKIVFSVPNSIFSQFKDAFENLSPNSDVTFIDVGDFKPNKRIKVLETIRDSEKGIYVFPYSCFDMIPLSENYYRDELKSEWDKVKNALENYSGNTAVLKRKEKELKKKLRDLDEKKSTESKMIYFDELGFNMVFVDEIHNYKNVSIDTSSYAHGINKKGSAKCNKMMDKVHFVQKSNGGIGAVLATGTPISNSMTDVFVMQKYLQNGELKMLGISTFDAWVNEFCTKSLEFEIDVDTSQYRLVTRYSKFVNLPELTSIFSSIAEFQSPDGSADTPDFEGYTDILVPKTTMFQEYLKDISQRCEAVRKSNVTPQEDNMLKITTDGRAAALDLRLVIEDADFTECSKVAYCANKVFQIYNETAEMKSSQLIFCDTSTPKAGFNIYDELKRLLLVKGVSEKEIAFIHDATNDNQRKQLFNKVSKGEIRILIGSTYKLGTGVNVQEKLIAVHHLDIPWKPSDMMQREGRIIRQGNENKSVYIFRYITEGSFDAYSYQLLENKQKIISQVLNGSVAERTVSDLDEAVLSYSEVKALAIGNPLIKDRFKTANELSRYRTLRAKSEESVIALRNELREVTEMLDKQNKLISDCFEDRIFLKENLPSPEINFRRRVQKKVIDILKNKENVSDDVCIEEDYCGFRIIFPAKISEKKPFIYIERNGRYRVEMGSADRGVMIRIDNVIAKIPEIHNNFVKFRVNLMKKREDIENEINHTKNYSEEIEFLAELLREIDKELGVA